MPCHLTMDPIVALRTLERACNNARALEHHPTLAEFVMHSVTTEAVERNEPEYVVTYVREAGEFLYDYVQAMALRIVARIEYSVIEDICRIPEIVIRAALEAPARRFGGDWRAVRGASYDEMLRLSGNPIDDLMVALETRLNGITGFDRVYAIGPYYRRRERPGAIPAFVAARLYVGSRRPGCQPDASPRAARVPSGAPGHLR